MELKRKKHIASDNKRKMRKGVVVKQKTKHAEISPVSLFMVNYKEELSCGVAKLRKNLIKTTQFKGRII